MRLLDIQLADGLITIVYTFERGCQILLFNGSFFIEPVTLMLMMMMTKLCDDKLTNLLRSWAPFCKDKAKQNIKKSVGWWVFFGGGAGRAPVWRFLLSLTCFFIYSKDWYRIGAAVHTYLHTYLPAYLNRSNINWNWKTNIFHTLSASRYIYVSTYLPT